MKRHHTEESLLELVKIYDRLGNAKKLQEAKDRLDKMRAERTAQKELNLEETKAL